jgi:galactokinase
MGGFAEYTGALTLSVPLQEHACVGVQRRHDGIVSITSVNTKSDNGRGALELSVQRLRLNECGWIDAKAGRALSEAAYGDAVCCALGALIESFRAGLFSALVNGVSVVLSSTLEDMTGGGRCAAIASATIVACAGACGEGIEPLQQAAAICETVENRWLGFPAGPADAVSALLGESNTLSQFRCDSRALGGAIRLPDDIRVTAIDCGSAHADAAAKYAQVRTASFMGRLLVDRIVQHDGLLNGHWDGFLSRVSVTDFVERFRDRIPSKLKGKDFLTRFGETGDPLTRVDPALVYKIRSRTEHHVYEHDRSRKFIEALSRAIRTKDRGSLRDAGEAMYASHWSCGQRCGLGSVQADTLVSLLRKHGEKTGIYGARMTSRGCGGIVAVLSDAGEPAQGALTAALEDYTRKTDSRARILHGSLSGAMVQGPLRA